MTGLSNKKYHSGSWFNRALKTGIFSGLVGLFGYVNATEEHEESPIQDEDPNLNYSRQIQQTTQEFEDSLAKIYDDSVAQSQSLQALEDSLKQAQQDSLFNLNAREYFLSEIPNLWFTNETDSLGNIYLHGISSKNNPRGLRHPDNTEKAHTAGGIPFQLMFSNGIRQYITFDNLKEIGRASLQSVVRNKNFQIPLEDVVIDTAGNFDIKYNGKEKNNFITGSLGSNGTLLILYADKPGEITTQVVILKEIYEGIYQRKLENDEEERKKIIKQVADSLRVGLPEGKTDTIQIDTTIVGTFKLKYSPLQAIEFLNKQLTDTLHSQVGIARNLENSYNRLNNALGDGNTLVDDDINLINQELKNLEELLKADSSFYPDIGKRISSLADSLTNINLSYKSMISKEKDAVEITHTSPELSDYERVISGMDSINIKPEIRSLNLIDSLGLDSLDLIAERTSVINLRKSIINLNRTYNNYLSEDSLHSEFGPAFYDQLKKIKELYQNRLNKLESLDKGLTTADLIRKDKNSTKKLIDTIDIILTPQKKEKTKERAKVKFKELFISLGASPYLSKNEYGADAIIDLDIGFGGFSIQGGYGIFSSISTTSHTGNPIGRNQRYLHQENERREEGLIPRMGAGISIGPLEAGLVQELKERRVTESVDEEVRNSDGSLYEVNDNYVKHSKKSPKSSIYGGLRIPLSKDWVFRARTEFGDSISPKYSIGLQKQIFHNKGVHIRK